MLSSRLALGLALAVVGCRFGGTGTDPFAEVPAPDSAKSAGGQAGASSPTGSGGASETGGTPDDGRGGSDETGAGGSAAGGDGSGGDADGAIAGSGGTTD